jgi:hypothetical protein
MREEDNEMPGKAERVRVEIKEVVSGDARTFNIVLTVTARDFLQTDLLKKRGHRSARYRTQAGR